MLPPLVESVLFNHESHLPGQRADLVIIDEAQDIDPEKTGLFSLQPTPPKAP